MIFFMVYFPLQYFEFTQPCKPPELLTGVQPSTVSGAVWVNMSPSCNMVTFWQRVPPQVLKFTVPASTPVLIWHSSGAGVAGGARVEVGRDMTAIGAVELQANISKSRRVKNVLMFVIFGSFSNSPAPKTNNRLWQNAASG
jgi:hypothetical protein